MRSPRRTVLGYLLVPRPKDLIKGLSVPFAFGIGALAAGGTSHEQVLRALVVWAALELLVYPARYQWNDIRGFVADQQHPNAQDRGRLPGPLDRARERVLASSAVALARLATAAGLVLMLPTLQLGGEIAAVTAAVFGVAMVYETLRARATGCTGRVPPPLRPALVGLWLVVGAGYAIRGITGLALAVDLAGQPLLGAAAVVTLWSFGVAFVSGRWALEALAFARLEGRRVIWSARSEQAREHSLALVRWLPTEIPTQDLPHVTGREAADWPALRGRTRISAPWNVAALFAGTAAALTGRLLTGPTPATAALLAAGSGAVTAAAVLAVPRRRGAAVLLGAAALAVVFAVSGAARPGIAMLPWLAVLGAHVVSTRQSLSSMGQPLRPAGRLIRAALVPIGRAAVGRATWAVLAAPDGERSDEVAQR
ncbi:MAG: hypothetical protein M3228_07030 [Actinomycetota bacterium]|nr:hypothetical protein [Actinomycetota bacterium]MDQ4010440.1 hypothetical protein [Actinomycetota bacterium]